MTSEALLTLSEEERKELYIEWLLNRGVAAATKKAVARLVAQMILNRLDTLWSLDSVTKETWESEAALRMMRFVQSCEKKGRGD